MVQMMYKIIKRILDIFFAIIFLFTFLPLFFIVGLAVKITSKGPVLYWSDRVGVNNTIFKMPKFRTMRQDTPPLATHLLHNPDVYLTPIGSFLRKSSLDEIPQFYSILLGDMSFVGPRPALFNQDDLIALRTLAGIHLLKPGVTGLAQINGRDNLSIAEKVDVEKEYLQKMCFSFDLYIIFLTLLKVISRAGVTH